MFETPSRRNFSTDPVHKYEKPTRMSDVVIVFIILIIIVFAFAGAVVSCNMLIPDTEYTLVTNDPRSWPKMEDYQKKYIIIEEIPAEEKNTL